MESKMATFTFPRTLPSDDRTNAINSAKKKLKTFRENRSAMSPPSSPEPKTANDAHQTKPATTITPSNSSSSLNGRPNSHHRRRSSMSTRRESAEMMGVTPPPVPETDDESVNTVDARNRTLLALEGRNSTFKVEIPEFRIPDMDEIQPAKFDWEHNPLPKSPFGMNPINASMSLAGKRDSFGKSLVPTSSSGKALLHTLTEEDEEEEEEETQENAKGMDEEEEDDNEAEQVEQLVHPTVFTVTAASPPRSRPALRPLSLVSSVNTGANTPSPRPVLKALALSQTTVVTSNTPTPSSRQSLVSPVTPTTSPTPAGPAGGNRRSSINYKRSSPTEPLRRDSLPLTPAYTPTHPPPHPFQRPFSPTFSDSSSSISLSNARSSIRSSLSQSEIADAEQTFFHQSHVSLLSRIATLEEKLESATKVPPAPPAPTPTEELIDLVADLKAQRDSLHSDIDEWRMRCNDLERNGEMLKNRILSERKECWELTRRLEQLQIEAATFEEERREWQVEKTGWTKEREMLTKEYACLQDRFEELRKEHEAYLRANVGRVKSIQPRRLQSSVDSQSTVSTTDVDDSFSSSESFETSRSSLKAINGGIDSLAIVTEEEEAEESDDDQIGGVYVEEEDESLDGLDEIQGDDMTDEFSEPSVALANNATTTPTFLEPFSPAQVTLKAPTPASSPTQPRASPQPHPQPLTKEMPQQHARQHSRKLSVIKTWKFPRETEVRSTRRKAQPSVDLFIKGLSKFDGSDDDEEEDEVEVVLLGAQMKSLETKKVVTTDMVTSFALNFGDDQTDDDESVFGFGVPLQTPTSSSRSTTPSTLNASPLSTPESIPPQIFTAEPLPSVTPVDESKHVKPSLGSFRFPPSSPSPLPRSTPAPPNPEQKQFKSGDRLVSPVSPTAVTPQRPRSPLSFDKPSPSPASFRQQEQAPMSPTFRLGQKYSPQSSPFAAKFSLTPTPAPTATAFPPLPFPLVPNTSSNTSQITDGPSTPTPTRIFTQPMSPQPKMTIPLPTQNSRPRPNNSRMSTVPTPASQAPSSLTARSLQTLTSFMSWSSRPAAPASVDEDDTIRLSAGAGMGTPGRGMVSREVMKERLRERLLREGMISPGASSK